MRPLGQYREVDQSCVGEVRDGTDDLGRLRTAPAVFLDFSAQLVQIVDIPLASVGQALMMKLQVARSRNAEEFSFDSRACLF